MDHSLSDTQIGSSGTFISSSNLFDTPSTTLQDAVPVTSSSSDFSSYPDERVDGKMAAQPGLSFKQTAEAMTSFLEVAIHTILCIRQIYPSTTFTRRRAHGVPVYQSRHPQVRSYISEVVALIGKEMLAGNMRRVTLVVKTIDTGLPLERFIFDMGYLDSSKRQEGHLRDAPLLGAPGVDELSLMLRGFMIRLTALDGQLEDNRGETTFAIVVETKDDLEPATNQPTDGSIPPWVPALQADTLRPPSDDPDCVAEHEPLLNVRAVETGVIDIRLMVQECVAKTGVEHLHIETG
ncbi:DNA-binding protein [Naematelia encephala]|uniref:DNA-binding protein n=1 Tax=Naematelia encephala TaxID=71784 RepID=A0A1Y2AHG1_9TREE|nr:DNA-binding protein [Naematelia encephala]